jgi:hypothetical protein
LQTVFQSRMEHDCLCSQMRWSTEMHRLTYSEWQAAVPRMDRRWNKHRRHQRDDDASSAVAETAQAGCLGKTPGSRCPGWGAPIAGRQQHF